MPFRCAFDSLHAGIRLVGHVGRGEEGGFVHAIHEARTQPRFVGGVFQQASHEVRHARNHFAHWQVLAHPEAHAAGGLLQFGGHAIEHLEFDRLFGKPGLLKFGKSGRDAAGVVGSDGDLHATLVVGAGSRVDQRLAHTLETSVGITLATPDRHWPAHLLGVDDLVVPVRALDQTHRDLASRALRPFDDSPGIVVTGTQIGLHGETGREIDAFAASHEEFKGEILERVVLHVEIDQDVSLGRLRQHRGEGFNQSLKGTFKINRIGTGEEGGDLDRDVGPGDRTEVIPIESVVCIPAVHVGGEVLDEVEVLGSVRRCFGVGDARLSEKVHAEGEALLPELSEHGQRVAGIGAGDELLRHAGDPTGHGLGKDPLGNTTRFHHQIHARGRSDTRLREVVGEMLVNLLRGPQHWERIDEAEQLNLERFILHGPVHQLVGPEGGAEHAGSIVPGPLQQVEADFLDPGFNRGVDRGDGGGRRIRRWGRIRWLGSGRWGLGPEQEAH